MIFFKGHPILAALWPLNQGLDLTEKNRFGTETSPKPLFKLILIPEQLFKLI